MCLIWWEQTLAVVPWSCNGPRSWDLPGALGRENLLGSWSGWANFGQVGVEWRDLLLFIILLYICNRDSESQGCLKTHYVVEDDLELLLPASLPPKFWDHKPMPPQLVYAVLRNEPRTSCTIGKPSTSWAPHPKTQSFWFVWFFPPAHIQAQTQQTQFPCVRSCEQTENFDNKEWAERPQPWSSSCWWYYHLLLPLQYHQHTNTRWFCLANSQLRLGVTLILSPRSTEYISHPDIPLSTDPLSPLFNHSQVWGCRRDHGFYPYC